MAIPKFNETMLPLLEFISNGDEYKVSEISDYIRDKYFTLSNDEKNTHASNWKTVFHDRLTWWRTYLKKAWLVEDPRRWYVKITNEWKSILKLKPNEITLNDLKKYESFLDFKYWDNSDNTNKNIDEDNFSPIDLVEKWYKSFSNYLRSELLERLKTTDPYYFEKIILILFKKMGYGDFEETSKSWDWWIDWIINQDQLWIDRIYTQAKRYTTSNVWERDIRNFIWAMSWDVSKWIFVTTSDFDKKAKEKVRDARNHKIILINWVKLADLMIKYNVWVQVKNIYEIKEIDGDFFEED